jgi:hypothetical protein
VAFVSRYHWIFRQRKLNYWRVVFDLWRANFEFVLNKKGEWFTAEEDIRMIVAAGLIIVGVVTTTMALLQVGDILVDNIITMTHPVIVEEVGLYFQGTGVVDSTDIITTLRVVGIVILPVTTTTLLPLQTILLTSILTTNNNNTTTLDVK